MTDEDYDDYYERIERGDMGYEEVADMFMKSMVGQSTRVRREDLLVLLRQRYPTPAELAGFLREAQRTMHLLLASQRQSSPPNNMVN